MGLCVQSAGCACFVLSEWWLTASRLPCVRPSLTALYEHFSFVNSRGREADLALLQPTIANATSTDSSSQPHYAFPWDRLLSSTVLPLLSLPDCNLPPLPGIPLPPTPHPTTHATTASPAATEPCTPLPLAILARHCYTHTDTASHKM